MCDNGLMTNNDVLRRLRYAFDYDDSKMMSLFDQGGLDVSRAEVSDWLKRDDAPDFEECADATLAVFLNGLIIDRRGRREGAQPKPEQRLNNNAILTKLKIAMGLKADDVVRILLLADYKISKHELSAFFRRADHRHFRECRDQILRRFLKGLELEYRGGSEANPTTPTSQE